MFLLLLQFRRVIEHDRRAIHSGPRITAGLQLLEEIDELTLAAPDHWCQDLELGPYRKLQDLIDDVLCILPLDRLVALRAMWSSCASEEKT